MSYMVTALLMAAYLEEVLVVSLTINLIVETLSLQKRVGSAKRDVPL